MEKNVPTSSATNKDKHLLDLNNEGPTPTSPLASRVAAGDQGSEGALPIDINTTPEREEVGEEEPPLAEGAPATALVLKFQPNNELLPSEQDVKVRFARFDPLNNDGKGTWVSAPSNMAMVVFKFRSHAKAALSYSRNHVMFGDQIKYSGYLIDLDAPLLRVDPSTPGSSGGSVLVGRQPIKSILRKRKESETGCCK